MGIQLGRTVWNSFKLGQGVVQISHSWSARLKFLKHADTRQEWIDQERSTYEIAAKLVIQFQNEGPTASDWKSFSTIFIDKFCETLLDCKKFYSWHITETSHSRVGQDHINPEVHCVYKQKDSNLPQSLLHRNPLHRMKLLDPLICTTRYLSNYEWKTWRVCKRNKAI
jgi:hypothetical protein